MIKYLGSKRKLIPHIVHVINECSEEHSKRTGARIAQVADAFSGTSRVGHALKKSGYGVYSNDFAHYAEHLARCYVEADYSRCWVDADSLIREAQSVADSVFDSDPQSWWVTQTSIDARYFTPLNARKIAAVREWIADKRKAGLSDVLHSILLVSLMEAADRVDSTVGVQMAYLKQYAARAYNPLLFRLPDGVKHPAEGPQKGLERAWRAYRGDTLAFLQQAPWRASQDQPEPTLVYLDPPYNQHSYAGNYHLWNTLCLWDNPDVYGVANKRVDVRETKSPWNSKRQIKQVMIDTLEAIEADWAVFSYSDEGFLEYDWLVSTLEGHGHLRVMQLDHDRYIGSQIGVYNDKGEKVGKEGHSKNTEYLFVLNRTAL